MNLFLVVIEYELIKSITGTTVSNSEQISQQDYVKKCKKAATKGNVVAQNTLGFLYLNGQGITQDYKEAAKWFRNAADRGYSAAQYNLAIMYKLGQGVEQSHPESIKWMQLAANQGYADAQYNLGNMYYQGLAVMQDYEMAYMWWLLAEQNGAKDTEHNKSEITKKMTASQVNNAQLLAREWHVKH